MTTTAPFPSGLIRPWYPAGEVGHIHKDCPDLLRFSPSPAEGFGWLNPRRGRVCEHCVRRHDRRLAEELFGYDASCDTCDASLGDDLDREAPPPTRAEAEEWMRDHECEPRTRLVGPPTPPVQVAPRPARKGQGVHAVGRLSLR